MTERKQEHAYPFVSINDERKVRSTAKRITRGLGFDKPFMRQCEVCVFSSSLTASALDRNPKNLTGIWSPRYQVNSSVIDPGTFEAVAGKQIQQN